MILVNDIAAEILRAHAPLKIFFGLHATSVMDHYEDFYRGMLNGHAQAMTVVGLIEDGVIEENLPISAALFAETIWNPAADAADILEKAMNLSRRGTINRQH